MRVRLIRPTAKNPMGTILDVPERRAVFLIENRTAIAVVDPAPAPVPADDTEESAVDSAFVDYLYEALPDNVVDELVRAGYNTREALLASSVDDLIALKGIGQAMVQRIATTIKGYQE